MHEQFIKELGDLPADCQELAHEFFTNLLNTLDVDPDPTVQLVDPGPLSTRERILGYLEQLRPGLRDSDHGPHVERALNALLARLHSTCSQDVESAR